MEVSLLRNWRIREWELIVDPNDPYIRVMVMLQGYARTRQSNIPTWRASPAALARPFEDYVRQLDRWIEEILFEDDPA